MQAVFLVIAVICEVIAALLGFGTFTGAHYSGWLALGLVFFAASFLVGPALTIVRRDG